MKNSLESNKKSVTSKKSTKYSTNKIKDLSMTTNKLLKREINGRKRAPLFKLR